MWSKPDTRVPDLVVHVRVDPSGQIASRLRPRFTQVWSFQARAVRHEQAAVACLHLNVCSTEPLTSGVGDGDAGRRAGRRGARPPGGRVVVLPRPFS